MEDTTKGRITHTPNPQTASTVSAEPEPTVSRQVRRADARRAEKRISQHMNEVVLKKNKRRG